MSFNWNLFGIMVGYAFFNGIGSLFYKIGLKKLDSEKISFIKFSKDNLFGFIQLLRNPIWLLGTLCLFLDFLIYQIALNLYEISVVKPLVNLNLIFVLTFGILIMKERISIKEWIGIAFIIIGAIGLSMFAENTTVNLNYTVFWIFMIITFIIIMINILLLNRTRNRNFEFYASISGGILYGFGSLCNKGFYAINLGAGTIILLIILFGISYALAFFYSQGAYLRGRMSVVSILVNVFSIITPFIGGILIYGDRIFNQSPFIFVSWLKILGLISIFIGILLTYKNTGDLENHLVNKQTIGNDEKCN